MGALVTVVIVTLTLMFTGNKFRALYDKSDTNFSSYTDVGKQKLDFSYGQKDGFEIAFQFFDYES